MKMDTVCFLICGKDWGGPALRSYRLRFRQHLCSKLGRQVGWGPHIDVNTEQRLQLILQATQVKQRRTWQCVNQQVKVATVLVRAPQNRAEDTRVRHTKTISRFAHGASLEIEHE